MTRNIVMIMLCTLVLAGCWDRQELNELGIVLAVALDKNNETGKIIITSQIVRPAELKAEGGGSKKSATELISAEGDTIFDAIRNISKQFDRRAYFAHNKIVVVDENIAREGVLPVLDFLTRSRELRRLAWLVVARNSTARDIIGVEHGIENIQATYLESIIKRRTVTSEQVVSNVLEFLKKVPGKQINPVAGVMEIVEQPAFAIEEKGKEPTKGVKLTGAGVFCGDKLIGYMDDIETRGFNWIVGKVESGELNVPSPVEKDKSISNEILKASSKIKPQVQDGKISFNIEVKEEGDIVGQQGSTVVSELEIFEQIEKLQNDVIKGEIKAALEKVQKELKSDIFGFGSELNKKYPKEWEKVKEDWNSIFPDVQCTVEVKSRLRRTGLLQKPIKPAGGK